MGFVKQRSSNDCAIAAVANACGVTYAAVKRSWGRCGEGLDESAIAMLLDEFAADYHLTRCRRRNAVSVAKWAARHPRGRYIISLECMPWDDFCHAVAVVDGQIIGHYAELWDVRYYFAVTPKGAV